ncbi:MAG TPA: PD-(D/E)XK nuclease family protein, partial [Chroococcales cyanobacterium]
SGSRRYSQEDAQSGRELQLPLYALAAERSILPGSRAAQGVYLSISSGENTGRLSFDPSKPAGRSKKSAGGGADQSDRSDRSDMLAVDHLKLAEEHTRQIVHRIESGDFSVSPNGKEVCTHCDHRIVCRIDEIGEVGAGVNDRLNDKSSDKFSDKFGAGEG